MSRFNLILIHNKFNNNLYYHQCINTAKSNQIYFKCSSLNLFKKLTKIVKNPKQIS